jgi:hypothetical protein
MSAYRIPLLYLDKYKESRDLYLFTVTSFFHADLASQAEKNW